MKYFIEYILLRILRGLLWFFPLRIISRTGAGIGMIFYVLKIRRNVARQNLIRAKITEYECDPERLIKRNYKNLGRTFTELLMNNRIKINEGRNFRWLMPENFLSDIRNGAILVSGHIGNWELMGKAMAQLGVKLAVVVRKQANPMTDQYINHIRESSGMAVIYDNDVFKLRRFLECGYSVALLADQDYGNQNIPVVFFGQPCLAPSGPARLALRMKLPLFVCTSFRKEENGFVFRIDPMPIEINSTQNTITQLYTTMIEDLIREHPDQWLWHHKRWKSHEFIS